MSGLKVLQPGLLSLIQDGGRYGHHRIGLTNGGPLDRSAFHWANRLCGNALEACALEISIGGFVAEADVDSQIVLAGGELPLKINGVEQDRWHSHSIKAGDRIEVGFSSAGARAYLAIAGGFSIEHNFNSASTVTRESIGGLTGEKLQQGDYLNCLPNTDNQSYRLAEHLRPSYSSHIELRVMLGYQHDTFSQIQQRIFFGSDYQVSDRADRMGYRLTGPEVKSSIDGILSEGICHGAIQVPADGQPIVLLNDRQTIGGYPKIGAMISLDTARVSQLLPGDSVNFEQITQQDAHNIYCLAQARFHRTEPQAL